MNTNSTAKIHPKYLHVCPNCGDRIDYRDIKNENLKKRQDMDVEWRCEKCDLWFYRGEEISL